VNLLNGHDPQENVLNGSAIRYVCRSGYQRYGMNPADIARLITEDPDIAGKGKWQLIVNPQRTEIEVSAMVDDPVAILVDRGLDRDYAIHLLDNAEKKRTPLHLIETEKHWSGYLIPPDVEFPYPSVKLSRASIEMIRDYLDLRDVDVGPILYIARDRGGCRFEVEDETRKMEIISRASEWPVIDLVMKHKDQPDVTVFGWEGREDKEDTFTFGEDNFSKILGFWESG